MQTIEFACALGQARPHPARHRAGEPPPLSTQLDLCARWRHQYLAAAGEPVKPADIVRAAAKVAFSRPTLYRARQVLAGFVVDLGTSAHDAR